MSNGVKLSPKYGLNPTMCQCFFCGEVKGIALLGRINPSKKRGRNAEDLEAPRMLVLDYEPCDKCKEKLNQGVLGIEVTENAEDRPPITKRDGHEYYPTGNYVVFKEESAQRIFNNPNLKKGGMCLLEEGLIDQMNVQ